VWVLAVVAALMGAARMGTAAAPSDALALNGPLSDFWPRVIHDWSLRIPGLNRGPLQTFIWVSLIWDGPEDLPIDDLADELQEREARHWVRSQITKHRWSRIEHREAKRMQALRQHLILVGTPEDNSLVRRALEWTPLRVSRGLIETGAGSFRGEGLLLVAIAPSPINPTHYALVFTGTSSAALVDAPAAPYGDTDYIILRGRKVLERGFFTWRDGKPTTAAVQRAQTFTEHFNWSDLSLSHFQLHYSPISTKAESVRRLSERMDADLRRSATFYGIPAAEIRPITCYLYPSVDEKAHQTGDSRPAHLDHADEAIHAVIGGGIEAIDPSWAALVLLRRATGQWGKAAETEMPGLALATSLACCEDFEGIPLARWVARSARDPGYLPMDLLLARRAREMDGGDLAALDSAAFLRDLILRDGAARVAAFYRTARRSDFHDRFKEIFGVSIKQAESRWLASLPPLPAQPTAAASLDRAPQPALEAFLARDDARAERLLDALPPGPAARTLLARIYFRSGRFDRAAAAAESLASGWASSEQRAWARLTLGRAHAMSGRLIAASAELSHDDILKGPEQVRVIADYWLETMGRPLNRRAANEILMEEADVDLMSFRWEEAEKKLQDVLAADPENREAHAALGKVYISKYTYWYDYILLDAELFPGTSAPDPEIYRYLEQKGNREIALAGNLPAGEQEKWQREAGPAETGSEQPLAHFLDGKVHYMEQYYEAARTDFETALSLGTDLPDLAAWCHFYLGKIAAAENDRPRARAEYEKALMIGGSPRVIALVMEALKALPAGGP
jgi:hypothetical protein